MEVILVIWVVVVPLFAMVCIWWLAYAICKQVTQMMDNFSSELFCSSTLSLDEIRKIRIALGELYPPENPKEE